MRGEDMRRHSQLRDVLKWCGLLLSLILLLAWMMSFRWTLSYSWPTHNGLVSQFTVGAGCIWFIRWLVLGKPLKGWLFCRTSSPTYWIIRFSDREMPADMIIPL